MYIAYEPLMPQMDSKDSNCKDMQVNLILCSRHMPLDMSPYGMAQICLIQTKEFEFVMVNSAIRMADVFFSEEKNQMY